MRGTLRERFLAKIKADHSGCWLFTGYVMKNGYGTIGLGSRSEGKAFAHRVAYELFVGPIPDGYVIDHLCRVRRCVNPEHLEAVTISTNLRRGAQSALRTHCPKGHSFDGTNRAINKQGHRFCRECSRVNARDYYWRNRRTA